MKIVFVGDQPSARNKSPDVAFVGTSSYKTLLEWIYRMNISVNDVSVVNSTDAALDDFCGEAWVTPEKFAFIALGTAATEALKGRHVQYFRLPHPSGKNRVLNDKKYVQNVLKVCERWLGEAYKNGK